MSRGHREASTTRCGNRIRLNAQVGHSWDECDVRRNDLMSRCRPFSSKVSLNHFTKCDDNVNSQTI